MHSKIEPEIKEEASKKPMLGLEVLSHKIELPFDGSRCSPDDLLTAGVDGVQGPLKLIFEGGRPTGEKPDIHTIQRLAILGQVHSMIVTLWEDCLWNGYRFHAHPEGFAFHPPTTERQAARASGVARMMAHQMEMTLHGRNLWNSMPLHLRNHFVSQRVSVNATGSGDRFRYKIGPAPNNPAEPIRSFTARVIASEIYLRELLEEPIPMMAPITPNILLSAWEVFHELGRSLTSGLPQNTGVENPEELFRFAPLIPRSKLTRLLTESLGLEYMEANRIVRFMTFSKNQSDELWARPFVEIDDRMVAPILVCLCDPNPLRMLERWMKHGGVNLQSRGPRFEIQTRTQLADAIHASKKLKNAGVLPHSFDFPDRVASVGDIDVVIWFGATVLIGEIKCNLFPAAPKELNSYFADLEYAADQIMRKKNAFEQNTADFWKKHAKQAEPSETKIIPFVITNLPIGVGYSFNSVPVVDLLILERFLEQGEASILGAFSGTGAANPVHSVTLYNTQEEAECVIQDYLENPPQLRLFKNGLSPRVTLIPTLTTDDRRWLVCDMDTDINTETVRQTLPQGVVDSLLGITDNKVNAASSSADGER
ncbi:MAG: hypothetical protein R3F13_12575 [Prosthecobacter sp.]